MSRTMFGHRTAIEVPLYATVAMSRGIIEGTQRSLSLLDPNTLQLSQSQEEVHRAAVQVR